MFTARKIGILWCQMVWHWQSGIICGLATISWYLDSRQNYTIQEIIGHLSVCAIENVTYFSITNNLFWKAVMVATGDIYEGNFFYVINKHPLWTLGIPVFIGKFLHFSTCYNCLIPLNPINVGCMRILKSYKWVILKHSLHFYISQRKD